MARDSSENLVVGAGPAGLTAARLLRERGQTVTLLEREAEPGGLCRTLQHQGFRFDLGGHRFFTPHQAVQQLWEDVLGQDLLLRPRASRVLYGQRLFPYPLRMRALLPGLGAPELLRCGASFARARLRPQRPELDFQRWVVNRFGLRLFQHFFKDYTEKVWGLPCTDISADWAQQRIRELSLTRLAREALGGWGDPPPKSLIQEFWFPRLGAGMLTDAMARELRAEGGALHTGAPVVAVEHDGRRLLAAVTEQGGHRRRYAAQRLLVSMPVTELLRALQPAAPDAVLEAAGQLRYRSLLTVNLALRGRDLFPDNWVYVQSPELTVGRIQNYGNWSPEMVPDAQHSAIGMEYFAFEGDPLWRRPDAELLSLALQELRASGLCARPPVAADLVGGMVFRVPRAYPVYHLGYQRPLEVLRRYLQRFENLSCLGRFGVFRYDNLDQAMMSAMRCVENLDGAGHDLWWEGRSGGYLEEVPAGRPGA